MTTEKKITVWHAPMPDGSVLLRRKDFSDYDIDSEDIVYDDVIRVEEEKTKVHPPVKFGYVRVFSDFTERWYTDYTVEEYDLMMKKKEEK